MPIGHRDSAEPRTPKISATLVLRYVLFQFPGWLVVALLALLLREPLGIELWAAWILIGIWIIKDIALFPLTWRLYAPEQVNHAHSLLGERGVADETLAPSGYVRVAGELWHAETPDANHPIARGTAIRVTGATGITLRVVEDEQK